MCGQGLDVYGSALYEPDGSRICVLHATYQLDGQSLAPDGTGLHGHGIVGGDARDNYFARLSYDYTYENTSRENRRWLKDLPQEIRFNLGKYRVLLCHGSPRRMNEFLWASTTSTHFLEKLCRDYKADIICATHTGIHWHRALPEDRYFVNAGVIGRPENNGRTHVGYTIIEIDQGPVISYVPIAYDYRRLAADMRDERLPEAFVETILESCANRRTRSLAHRLPPR